tara:strand:- start:45 stop:512 length:468 start_codon:yes stop_codon:yes gene_type:complete
MDIFSINQSIVLMEALIINKGYVDAEVCVRLEDTANRSWNRMFRVDIYHNLTAEYGTRKDKTFSLLTGMGLDDAQSLMDQALEYVQALPSKEEAAGAANIRTMESLISDWRDLEVSSDTEELRIKYKSLADSLEVAVPEVTGLRFQAGYHITDQS